MPTISWSNPVRRRGKQALAPIPNELYLEILKNLRPPKAEPWLDRSTIRRLARLSLVCRFFYSVMAPWMFESMEVIFRARKDGSASQELRKFCKAVGARGEAAKTAAKYVKRCSITCLSIELDKPEDPAPIERACMSIYSKAVWHMSNMDNLNLSSVTVTKEFLLSLANLCNLKTLTVEDCLLAEDVNERHLRSVSSLKLKKLVATYTNMTGLAILNGTVAAPFHRFFDHIAPASLVEVTTSSWYLVKLLARRKETLSLETLCMLFVNDIHLLPTLFQRMPSLKTLRALGALQLLDEPDIPFRLDSELLPVLEEVHAPVALLSGIIPRRPISNIQILQLAEIDPVVKAGDIAAFTSSSSVIHEMQIHPHLYSQYPFFRHFPGLKTLRINLIRHKFDSSDQKDIHEELSDVRLCHFVILPCSSWLRIPQILTMIFNAYPMHPPLHTVKLELEERGMVEKFLDLPKQHQWISDILEPKLPTLRCVRLSDFMQWTYCERKKEWIPMLFPRYARVVISLYKTFRGSIDLVDFGGYFHHLLRHVKESDNWDEDSD
ncbi:hypothetical protein CVT26_005891 [Gymnopilus dilepis]|uniref:F-box domain-containing protein n=1 Tax=Gymnopilus dilepis TaxID=231916 RepID=A0A409Y1L6_9AGAR|nr:hypothetical protein CVT26_005891 [Gymnopilus dilepis]